MNIKAHVLGFAFLAMLIAPGLAQTASSAEDQFVSNAAAGDWRASKLVGVSIYGPNDEHIGKVNDVLIDASGSAKAVVIGVGGFLGVGEKNVAMSFSEIKWSDEPLPPKTPTPASTPVGTPSTGTALPAAPRPVIAEVVYDYPDHGTVTLTRDQLKGAPDFHYASEKK